MADIAKCHGQKTIDGQIIHCNVMLICKRYTALAGEYQAYIEPGDDFTKQNGCILFMPTYNIVKE